MVRLIRIMDHLKIDNWYYIELKNLCVSKKIINRVKKQPMEWEQIIANHISDKEFIYIYIYNFYNHKIQIAQLKNVQI